MLSDEIFIHNLFLKVICFCCFYLFIYFQSDDQEALTKLFAGQDKSEEVRATFSDSNFNILHFMPLIHTCLHERAHKKPISGITSLY
jgi:hypothetical protein